MARTTLVDLINPDVFGDAVMAKMGKKIRLFPIAKVENLIGQDGGNIVVPQYGYIGDAAELADGSAMTPVKLSQSSVTIPVKMLAKSIEITDMAANNAYGDPVGESEDQLSTSLANGLDADLFANLSAITGAMLHAAVGAAVNSDLIAEALEKFGEDQEGEKYLLVSPARLTEIRKDPGFQRIANNEFGIVGEIYGASVVVSERVAAGEAFIVKPGALGVYLKKDANIEVDRDVLAKSTVLAGDTQYAAHVRDESKAIKIALV
jgi:N4-gp56 family major capsid protein